MNTVHTSLDVKEEADPRLFERSKTILKAMNPNLEPERLDQIAKVMARHTKLIRDSSSNLEQFESYVEGIKKRSETYLPSRVQERLQSTYLQFGIEKEKILQERDVTSAEVIEGNLAEELEKEVTEAAVKSIKKTQKLQQETCTTCQTPNRLITVDSNVTKLLKKCSRCKKAMYCSVQCQNKDWNRHKIECLQK